MDDSGMDDSGIGCQLPALERVPLTLAQNLELLGALFWLGGSD